MLLSSLIFPLLQIKKIVGKYKKYAPTQCTPHHSQRSPVTWYAKEEMLTIDGKNNK